MKKFLAIFLVLTLLFSFAACNKDGNKDDESTTNPTEQTDDNGTTNKNEPSSRPNKNEEKTTAEPFVNPNLTEPAKLFKVVDVKNYDLKEGKPNTTASSGVTFIAKRYTAKNPVNTIPNTVSVGSSQFVLHQTTLNDIVAQGWTLVGRTDINQAVKAGAEANAMIKNGQNEIIKIKVMNKTANVAAAGDCVISEAGIVKSIKNSSEWATFKLGDTVNTDSAYAEVVKTFGNPKNITVAEYYKGNTYNYCKATLVYEQKVDNITYTVSIGYTDENGKATLDSFIVSAK